MTRWTPRPFLTLRCPLCQRKVKALVRARLVRSRWRLFVCLRCAGGEDGERWDTQ